MIRFIASELRSGAQDSLAQVGLKTSRYSKFTGCPFSQMLFSHRLPGRLGSNAATGPYCPHFPFEPRWKTLVYYPDSPLHGTAAPDGADRRAVMEEAMALAGSEDAS